jgi:hypothetical protein
VGSTYQDELNFFKTWITDRLIWLDNNIIGICYELPPLSIAEKFDENRVLLRVLDVLGRETKSDNNQTLFYIYDDGSVEKRIIIE